MRIGLLLPGFSAHEADWAIPAQQNLARLLASGGERSTPNAVRIIALRYPHHQQPYTLAGAAVYPLGAAQGRGLARLRLWRAALRLIERLHRAEPFDVLHAMWADETGLIAAWAGRRLGVPVVVSILGGELIGLHDIGYGHQRGAFSRWIVRQALRGADRVIVPSAYVRRLLAGFGVSETRIVPITLGVDAARFTPAAAPPDPYRLIHVASLSPVKDQALLLRAFARLDRRAALDIIGSGSERARLETLAGALGIHERVRFVGAVAHTDLPAYYQRAALHVLTSRHETIALTTLEAAACGVPTVSTDVGIVPDYPTLGVVAAGRDPAALADAIQALLDDPARQTALAQSARAVAAGALSIEVTAEKLLALYRELASTDS